MNLKYHVAFRDEALILHTELIKLQNDIGDGRCEGERALPLLSSEKTGADAPVLVTVSCVIASKSIEQYCREASGC